MAKQTLKDLQIYYEKYDFSTDHDRVNFVASRVEGQCPGFNQDMRRVAGIKSAMLEHSGFFEAGTRETDTIFMADWGVGDKVLSVAPKGFTKNLPVYFTKMNLFDYKPIDGAVIGGMAAFSGVMKTDNCPVVMGKVLAAGAKTTTGNGTAYQIGDVDADQILYAALHVVSYTGSDISITVKIQSDDAEAFTDPTDRITFSTITSTGVEWATPVTDTITDDWWRAVWTITGDPASFTMAIVMGILGTEVE